VERNKPITLRDVADEAGVSITTVSRILNNRTSGVPIREETRQRIFSVADRLGYRPNLLARGLRGSPSSLIGVIVRDISDPFHIQVLQGINDAARQKDYRVFLGHVAYRPDMAIDYGSMFERSHADGIILIGDLEGGEEAVDVLAKRHRFVIGVSDRAARRQVPGVYADSRTGTELAMDHLWDLGHRSIVCVADSRTYDGRARIERYERYMTERGSSDEIKVHLTDEAPEASLELGRRLFAAETRIPATAIYAASDTTAIGLMQAAFQCGIAIPDGLSIVGYDNIDISQFTIPPLTTVSQTGVEMGQVAAQLLFSMIKENLALDEVEDVVLHPTLVVRQSTAPPSG
jgi:DNA-binding LacI/PurR family transcriptional regulator